MSVVPRLRQLDILLLLYFPLAFVLLRKVSLGIASLLALALNVRPSEAGYEVCLRPGYTKVLSIVRRCFLLNAQHSRDKK